MKIAKSDVVKFQIVSPSYGDMIDDFFDFTQSHIFGLLAKHSTEI